MKLEHTLVAEGPNKGRWTFAIGDEPSRKYFPTEAALVRYLMRKKREADRQGVKRG